MTRTIRRSLPPLSRWFHHQPSWRDWLCFIYAVLFLGPEGGRAWAWRTPMMLTRPSSSSTTYWRRDCAHGDGSHRPLSLFSSRSPKLYDDHRFHAFSSGTILTRRSVLLQGEVHPTDSRRRRILRRSSFNLRHSRQGNYPVFLLQASVFNQDGASFLENRPSETDPWASTSASPPASSGRRSYAEVLDLLRECARITSHNVTAVARAQELWEEWASSSTPASPEEDAPIHLTTELYNIWMEVHAYAHDPDHGTGYCGATKAELLLQRLMEPDSPARPDMDSFAKVMEAWTQRQRLDRVQQVFDQAVDYFSSASSSSSSSSSGVTTAPVVEIDLYNKLIRAHGMRGQAERAEALLEQLLEAASTTDVSADRPLLPKPNQKTWVHVLRAYAGHQRTGNSSPAEDAATPLDGGSARVAKIVALLERMHRAYRQSGQRDWKPTAEAYNTLLMALSHAREASAAKEAEKVLYDMIQQYREEGDADLCPTAESFYHVLHAYRGSTDAGVVFKVEKLLQLQVALAQQQQSRSTPQAESRMADDEDRPGRGDTRAVHGLWPNAKIYSAAMAAMVRTRDPKKAVKAKRLLDRMKREHEQTGDDQLAPNIYAYRNLLNACAQTHGAPEDRLTAFQIAVEVVNELRQSTDLVMDSSLFALFLRACNLMPASRKKDMVIESVFAKCCKDGLVSDYVLRQFEKAASEELQLRVLGGFLEDGVPTPPEWRRNVQGGR